ncbi:unnamed protein product [Cylicocyclus nassatus]|uniref:Uncharacterized protein n=1 Tax=Cylicocyclus nassatus TaxID=53992 RepID=A0AA36GX92_CYLNA|nr:unnamed protein product [Cylicocyclus nassatus]
MELVYVQLFQPHRSVEPHLIWKRLLPQPRYIPNRACPETPETSEEELDEPLSPFPTASEPPYCQLHYYPTPYLTTTPTAGQETKPFYRRSLPRSSTRHHIGCQNLIRLRN